MALQSFSTTCPNCGGRLQHKQGGKYVCPYCDSAFFDPNYVEPAVSAQPADDEPKKKANKAKKEETTNDSSAGDTVSIVKQCVA